MQILSELGPFFAVDVYDAAPGSPWRPVAELIRDQAVWDRIGSVQQTLRCHQRVAASIAHLGMVARLLSPPLATAVGDGIVADLSRAYWQPPLETAFRLSLPADSHPTAHLVGTFLEQVIGPVAALTSRIGELVSISNLVLWGNVASALNGAALALGPSSYSLVDQVLLSFTNERPPAGRAFRRHSCCLIYRAGRRGFCADCVLAGR